MICISITLPCSVEWVKGRFMRVGEKEGQVRNYSNNVGMTPHLNLSSNSGICVIIRTTLAATTNKPANFSRLSTMKLFFIHITV